MNPKALLWELVRACERTDLQYRRLAMLVCPHHAQTHASPSPRLPSESGASIRRLNTHRPSFVSPNQTLHPPKLLQYPHGNNTKNHAVSHVRRRGRRSRALLCLAIPRLDDGEIVRYGAGEPGVEGSVKIADFTLGGQPFRCIDSPAKHEFTFTPAFSLFVECADEAELDQLFAALSKNGKVLMPPDNYGFSKKFCWTNDRFGVSWQLNYQP